MSQTKSMLNYYGNAELWLWWETKYGMLLLVNWNATVVAFVVGGVALEATSKATQGMKAHTKDDGVERSEAEQRKVVVGKKHCHLELGEC